ncbi:hypothetical protein ACFWPK_34365 [Nocardia sp. NPDC058519]|uniref:hypothetical protein n=1 Tax=Nocardia sp. NPDC058519 TaxID=3346535 RepID=UPI003663074D
MTNPVAVFDQTRANLAVELDGLVGALIDSHARCKCGGSVDSTRHLLILAEFCRKDYTANALASLLMEAVARLAVAKEAN